MKSEIIFIIVVIVLAAFMYISLFGLIIDTFETRRYKIEYKSTVGAIKSILQEITMNVFQKLIFFLETAL